MLRKSVVVAAAGQDSGRSVGPEQQKQLRSEFVRAGLCHYDLVVAGGGSREGGGG